MAKRMEIKQIIPQEFCLKCCGCCRFSHSESVWKPHLLEEEKSILGEINIKVNHLQDNFICQHLELKSNKCDIYNNRPFDCRFYPFLFNRKNGSFFLSLDTNCAYVCQIGLEQQFQRHINNLIELVRGPRYLDILRRNPQLFQGYDGVLDLVKLDI